MDSTNTAWFLVRTPRKTEASTIMQYTTIQYDALTKKCFNISAMQTMQYCKTSQCQNSLRSKQPLSKTKVSTICSSVQHTLCRNLIKAALKAAPFGSHCFSKTHTMKGPDLQTCLFGFRLVMVIYRVSLILCLILKQLQQPAGARPE